MPAKNIAKIIIYLLRTVYEGLFRPIFSFIFAYSLCRIASAIPTVTFHSVDFPAPAQSKAYGRKRDLVEGFNQKKRGREADPADMHHPASSEAYSTDGSDSETPTNGIPEEYKNFAEYLKTLFDSENKKMDKTQTMWDPEILSKEFDLASKRNYESIDPKSASKLFDMSESGETPTSSEGGRDEIDARSADKGKEDEGASSSEEKSDEGAVHSQAEDPSVLSEGELGFIVHLRTSGSVRMSEESEDDDTFTTSNGSGPSQVEEHLSYGKLDIAKKCLIETTYMAELLECAAKISEFTLKWGDQKSFAAALEKELEKIKDSPVSSILHNRLLKKTDPPATSLFNSFKMQMEGQFSYKDSFCDPMKPVAEIKMESLMEWTRENAVNRLQSSCLVMQNLIKQDQEATALLHESPVPSDEEEASEAEEETSSSGS